ncbi:MAG: LysM peptidoglycan-binding domain-containing protein [Pseudomonadota bacterium]|nr:LysM peptidoglycan-binding domain-containing protein [Pseudomonadota bacterium]
MLKALPALRLWLVAVCLASAALAAQAAVAAPAACGKTVTVARGDTLKAIAGRCKTTVAALLAANRGLKNPNLIKTGTRLRLPAARSAAAKPPPVAKRQAPAAPVAPSSDVEFEDDIGVADFRPLAPMPDRGSRREKDAPTVEIRGTLTDEGVECPAVRTEDGKLYTLVGDLHDARPGDRLLVKGTRAEMSFCMQGITLVVQRVEQR